jgi:hypothetical protein
MEYREEFEYACDSARQSLPKEAFGAAQWSLFYGPSGAEMSFDDAISSLRDWADKIETVRLYEFDEDECGEEIEVEAGEIDACDIVREIVGRELYAYI